MRMNAFIIALQTGGISQAIWPSAFRRGYYWFIGRADDIIKTSGHMVSPF